MVPTDDENLQILDRSFDVFAEFATKIRYADCALTTPEQLTTTQLLNQILPAYHWLLLFINTLGQHSPPDNLFLSNNCVDKQLSSNLKHLPQRVML